MSQHVALRITLPGRIAFNLLPLHRCVQPVHLPRCVRVSNSKHAPERCPPKGHLRGCRVIAGDVTHTPLPLIPTQVHTLSRVGRAQHAVEVHGESGSRCEDGVQLEGGDVTHRLSNVYAHLKSLRAVSYRARPALCGIAPHHVKGGLFLFSLAPAALAHFRRSIDSSTRIRTHLHPDAPSVVGCPVACVHERKPDRSSRAEDGAVAFLTTAAAAADWNQGSRCNCPLCEAPRIFLPSSLTSCCEKIDPPASTLLTHD